MNLTEEIQNLIQEKTYAELLSYWRFSPLGDDIFMGETGEFFRKVLFQKKEKIGNAHIKVSKEIGFEKPDNFKPLL